ncbi:GNAT family N-acetyltransferase [Microvirga flavescens]|uniref:GNAT family N-acetyltransferase n=1 Tax=Microvirga flavescens TaxID=2249811 RepID=UPI000DD6B2CD|nr:GNAT family protein [Microvirga flavescens]
MVIRTREGSAADIPFVMATEHLPGFDAFIGRWDEAQHNHEIAKAGSAYLIAEKPDGSSAGFAIIRDLDEPFGNVLLKRIAVSEPGHGVGRTLLLDAMAWVFTRTNAHRFYLDVLVQNERAQNAYRHVGFQQEGIMREIYTRPDGSRVSALLMSILRPEWVARYGSVGTQ